MPDLTDDDYTEIAALLRQAIDTDRYPLSPRVRRLRAILDKIEPPAPKPQPLPPPRPAREPSLYLQRKKARRR